MRDESSQQQQKFQATSAESIGYRWGESISEERNVELKERIADYMRDSQSEAMSPFVGVKLTGADLMWLAGLAITNPQLAGPSARFEAVKEPTPDVLSRLQRAVHEPDVRASFQPIRLNLAGADLAGAYLNGAVLRSTLFEHANLYGVHFEGANLQEAHLGGAILIRATFDVDTDLTSVRFDAHEFPPPRGAKDMADFAVVGDIKWGGVDLRGVDWQNADHIGADHLGDEHAVAWQARGWDKVQDSVKAVDTELGRLIAAEGKLEQHKSIVRAYRQIVSQLRQQGLNEEADNLSYRGQMQNRTILWRDHRPGSYLFSWLIFLLAGYGYRPARSLF